MENHSKIWNATVGGFFTEIELFNQRLGNWEIRTGRLKTWCAVISDANWPAKPNLFPWELTWMKLKCKANPKQIVSIFCNHTQYHASRSYSWFSVRSGPAGWVGTKIMIMVHWIFATKVRFTQEKHALKYYEPSFV